MNIMKTNMLLLDNKIRKDDAENTSTIAAPIPSSEQSQASMNALMFKGLQNLMANPALAKEVGVMNDDASAGDTDNSAKSYVAPYSSNIAFQGTSAAKAKTLAMGALIALSSAVGLSSCREKIKVIDTTPSEISNVTTINIDFSELTAMTSMMQSTLTQMLMQQQLSYEQFQKYMEQVAKWQEQMNQRLGNLEYVLTNMGDKIFDIDNHLVKGFNENNAYQQMIVGMLEQFMTRDEAVAYFNKLCAEIDKVAAAENATDADLQRAIANAVAQIMSELKLVNENLDTIINNQDRAYAELKNINTNLQLVKGNTDEMKAIAKASYEQLINVNNTIIDSNNKVVDAINNLDGDVKAGVETVAKTLGWSTYQVITYMNKMGINIQNSNAWNASMIIAAINYNTKVTKQGNEELAKIGYDIKADAEKYAEAMLEVMNNVDAKLGILVEDFNTYADAMNKKASIAINELKKGNKTTAEIKNAVKDVIANQLKAEASRQIMIQKLDKIDVDMNAGIEALAKQLGCSTAQIIGMMKWLGYTEAQVSTMNAHAIINAIKGSSNKIVAVLGDKINTVIEKIDNHTISEEAGIAEIVSLLENIDGNVADIKSTLSEFVADWKSSRDALNAKLDKLTKYARDIRNDQRYIAGTVSYIAGAVGYIAQETTQIEKDLRENNKIGRQILEKIENNDALTASEMEEIAKRLNGNIQEGLGGIAALLRADLNKQDVQIDLLAKANAKLDGLGTVSVDILNAVENLGDDLSGLQNLSDKIDELIAVVKNFSAKVDGYAKDIINAHSQEIAILNGLKSEINNIDTKTQTLINQAQKAEIQRTNIENAIKSIKTQIANLEAKLGRSITPEELDSILSKHDVSIGDLKVTAKIDPADLSNIEALIKALNNNMVGYQGEATKLYIEILNAIKGLNKTSPDYNQKLDEIKELLKNFKFECNCQADCDNNKQVHEGIINIIS